jgi:hypothetical protein
MEAYKDYLPQEVIDVDLGICGTYRVSKYIVFISENRTIISYDSNIIARITRDSYSKVEYLGFKAKHENYLNYLEDDCRIHVERLNERIFNILRKYDLSKCKLSLNAYSMESFMSFSKKYGKLCVKKLIVKGRIHTSLNIPITYISCKMLYVSIIGYDVVRFYGTNEEILCFHYKNFRPDSSNDYIDAYFTNAIFRLHSTKFQLFHNVNTEHPKYDEYVKELIYYYDFDEIINYCK